MEIKFRYAKKASLYKYEGTNYSTDDMTIRMRKAYMTFNKYFFENYPMDVPFDRNNPRYVLSLDGVDEILEKIIRNKPFSLGIEDFENAKLVHALLHIEVLQQKNEKIGMAVPFFIEKDAVILKELSKKVAGNITDELIKHKELLLEIIDQIENGYSSERNLYHLLCGYIFDGLMFDYLEENHLVTTSCIHKTGLDYLVILYEDSDALNEYSDLLLCSYNRFIINGKGFVSFGDSNGNRKDFYRYMRLKELNRLSEQEKMYMDCPAEKLIENFDRMIAGEQVEAKYIEIYNYFGYCKNENVIVPVYDEKSYKIADKLYKLVLDITKEPIAKALTIIQSENRLSSIAHNVEAKDIANEIYHLIFGEVNEILVQNGIVSEPLFIQGQGRYLKAFER